MFYLEIKYAHMAFAVVSIALLAVRFSWSLTAPERLRATWVRILPHANDTLLLACAIYLMTATRQYPFVQGWLTAKFFALLVYIALGNIALKRARTPARKVTAAIMAGGIFAYIVVVAFTKRALPL